MSRIDYHAPVSRPWQVLAGVLLAPLAAGALAVAYAGARMALAGRPLPPGSGVAFPAFALAGIAGLVLAFRLLLDRPRRPDRGLLSPVGLRIAGVAWLVAGLALAHDSPAWILELGLLLAAAGACFALARKRQRDAPS